MSAKIIDFPSPPPLGALALGQEALEMANWDLLAALRDATGLQAEIVLAWLLAELRKKENRLSAETLIYLAVDILEDA